MDNTTEFRLLSLCSGYAGLELGLRRVVPNLRTVAYVEVEAFAVANLVSKMEKGLLDVAPIWTDIKTFNGWSFRRNIHIITAGYPCQPFSVAGKRQGTDDPRHLWPYIERIIEAVRPVWYFFENVAGHLTIGFPEVYRSLRNLGYAVEAGLFTAAECGAPHRRERLFILAYRSDSRCENVQIQQTRQSTSGNSCKDLVHARGTESRGLSDCQRQKNPSIRPASELADTTGKQIQRTEPERAAQAGRQIDKQGDKWPARPGQFQYEWEEPRVVAYPSKPIARRQSRKAKLDKGGETISQRQQTNSTDSLEFNRKQNKQRQAQSSVGRAADGTPCRVDRLRLLGNGVVPQQAEKAFRYLMAFFEANK